MSETRGQSTSDGARPGPAGPDRPDPSGPAPRDPGRPGPGPSGPGRPDDPERPRGGILMGRPFGVPVYVTPTWFVIAALITWVFGSRLGTVLPGLGRERYLLALFFAVAFYASVLVHELAHTLVALRYRLPVRRIQLQFLGGVSEIEKEAETPGREFWLAFSGPLLSLVTGGVFYLGLRLVRPDTVPGVLLAGLMASNVVVAAFNLLPGLPLDGGRMLRAAVWRATGRPLAGTAAAAWAGRCLAVAVLVGLPLLTARRTAPAASGADTLTDAVLAAVLAAVIWNGAGQSLRTARLKEALPRLRVRALTRPAVQVAADTPLAEALRQAREAGARGIVVVDGRGEPRALVREAAVLAVPERRRPWTATGALARDLLPGMRLSADGDGEELLAALRRAPASEYLVVEADGTVHGVLSLADVERVLAAAMAGR
ncbi:site-2 protease family protein [Streptacidiphilus sp. ASG 303]|uniref:site-2 protease family protein n=1 Tax=Streptacidiphilus sp. ASG 303 TaxID=2896847 RepID=UPI001E5CA5A5|nr:site-2 protease family protein [Streptacidiphilus sp. ASG 303]MCD0481335.1 site-2 protease family protein [Streptacidiphilus sp. ASG 303]